LTPGLDLRRAGKFLEGHLADYLADLEELVNIDSGTFDKPGVDRVVSRLGEWYGQLGAAVERIPHPEFGDTLRVTLRGTGPGRILLLGHTDTVYRSGIAAERPFRVQGSVAYGPGTSDMKAGDLAIIYALLAVLDQGPDRLGDITVVHNSDEEIGSPISRSLIRTAAEEVDAVLVLEAGRQNGDIVSARKGIADVELTVRGVAAHAGVDHKRGRSALLELAHLVVALEGLNGTIPGVTLNVGQVRAGDRVNVVPDLAAARFEIRAFEREHLVAAVEAARRIVERRAVPGTVAEMSVTIAHWPMQRSPASEQLVREAQQIASDLGFDLHDAATGGASDGNTAAEAGVPALDGLGPIGGGAHSEAEYIDIDSVVPRVTLLAGLIGRLGAGPVKGVTK
jgi:glutamate carboxypeptidase